jgi:hypothetical protein
MRMKFHSSITSRAFSVPLLVLMLAMTGFAEHTNPPAITPPDFTAKLHYGKEIALTPRAVQTLYSNAVKLVKSSNFNHSDVSKVADDYRFTISGSYLLISFNKLQNIKTVGGDVSVREIIIALNERYGQRSELFTKDDGGHIFAHGKYSGPIIVELLKMAKELASNA